jgi:hypothetical protein
MNKVCRTCNEEKPLESGFYRLTGYKDRYNNECKICARERSKIVKKEWYKKNTEKALGYHRNYIKTKGRALVNRHSAKYRATKLNATPVWIDDKAIKLIFDNCPVDKHVDHIVPLNSPIVCGLHWEGNLTYLAGSQNISKGNRYWPTMTAEEVEEATQFYRYRT